MGEIDPIRLPVAEAVAAERTWGELVAAITMVSEGRATRVALANLEVSDALAGDGAVLAQQAGVAFVLERDGGAGRHIRIGPRLPR